MEQNPNRISPKAIAALALLGVAAIGLFAYTFFFTKEQTTEEEVPEVVVPAAETVTAKHQFKNGIHIIAGEANVPTPCHRLLTNVLLKEGSSANVELAFTTDASDDICAQVITPARFKSSFEAPENAIITATWNGAPVTLNLIPASEGENLDDFEIFIKG